MELTGFCEKIGLSEDAAQAALSPLIGAAEYAALRGLFFRDRSAFYAAVNAHTDAAQRFLWLYVRLAAEARGAYEQRGIAENVYYDTFQDLSIWCEACRRRTGRPGLTEYDWLWRHIRLRLFRLGRLQFEPVGFDRDLDTDTGRIRVGEVALNVHIPEGEPLNREACEKSFALAARFFRGIPPVFLCHSWLLGRDLQGLLKPGSNILQFRKFFTVYAQDEAAREAEQRIFGEALEACALYPESTSLQRAAKAHLLSGGKLGSGLGIYFMPEQNF